MRKSFVVWFTGLPCSGKTTLASALAEKLIAAGNACEHLDGDVLRAALGSTGFTREEREKHLRQMAYWASRFEAQGVFVVASFVSPYRESREHARSQCRNFIEIHVSTPLEVCKERDVKGMYRKALAGDLVNFTGVDDPYEPPLSPDFSIDTTDRTIESCLEEIWDVLVNLDFDMIHLLKVPMDG